MIKKTLVAGTVALWALLSSSQVMADPKDGVFFSEWSHGEQPPRRDLGQWVVTCRRDSFTDEASCSIRATLRGSRPGDLVVTLEGKDSTSIVVGGGPHKPGSAAAVRIDDGGAISWPAEEIYSGDQAAQVVGQLRDGTVARSRWASSVSSTPLDQEMLLSGFGVAVDRARSVLSGSYSYTPSEAASAAFWLTVQITPHLAGVRLCDPSQAQAVEQRIVDALRGKPQALASHQRSKDSVMVGAELNAKRLGVGGINCPAAKLALDRTSGRLLDEAARFQ